MKRIRKPPAGRIWIDGIEQPVEEVRLEIFVNGDGLDEKAAAPTASYSLMVIVDENSGEDGAACPMSQTLPVQRACGGRDPSLAELGSLTLTDGDDWEACLGNDSPPLCENHLQFGGWVDPTRVRITWTARYAQPHEIRLLAHRAGPDPGTMKFEGEARFLSIAVCADTLEDADRLVATIWDNAQLAALDRHEPRWQLAHELRPEIRRRLPRFLGRWLAAQFFAEQWRRQFVRVTYHPRA